MTRPLSDVVADISALFDRWSTDGISSEDGAKALAIGMASLCAQQPRPIVAFAELMTHG